MKFKVGDKVRVRGNLSFMYPEHMKYAGEILTIDTLLRGGEFCVVKEAEIWFRKDMLELVTDPLADKIEERKYYVLDEGNIPFLAIRNGEVNREPMHMTIYAKGRDNAQFALTEQEIKDYDPRYWAFRKPVEEMEE